MYHLLRLVIRIIIRQFFLKIRLKGDPQVEHGSLIIAATHPNEAVDPFLIGSVYSRETYFLAKSTLFKNPILGGLFRAFHMIPVYRPSDKSDTRKNEESFRSAAEILKKQKAIVIFPEGTSREERQILSLKTGAARIAFLAESESLFKLGTKIQPVSITYGEPEKFQSTVTIAFGTPIELIDYKDQYIATPREAVQKVTDDLERALRNLSVDLKDIKNQELVEKIATVFRAHATDDQTLFKTISEKVEALTPLYPAETSKIIHDIDHYLALSAKYYVDEYHSYTALTETQKVYRLMLSPIILFGILTHAVPYYLVRLFILIFVKDPIELASFKIGLSLILFPIWYILLFMGMIYLHLPSLLAILLMALIMASGHFTNRYIAETWTSLISYAWPGRFDPIKELDNIREELQARLRGY